MKNSLLFKGYVGFGIFYFIILLFGLKVIAWIFKPFIIPFLAFGVYFFKKDFPAKKLLLSALLFSWMGDVLLMFSGRNEIYFILGLLSFLTTHILYCILFYNQLKSIKPIKNITYFIGCSTILIYLILILSLLFPNLGNLTVPVIIYALVISTMLWFALKGYLVWKKPVNKSIFVGAIIFVISDSILAFDKFYKPIESNSILIMCTYILAQYLIVTGILKLNTAKNKS